MSSEGQSGPVPHDPRPDLSVIVLAAGVHGVAATLDAIARQDAGPAGVEVVLARTWPAGESTGEAGVRWPGDPLVVDVAAASLTAAANAAIAGARARVCLLLVAGDLPVGSDLLARHLAEHRAGSTAVFGAQRFPALDPVADGWVGRYPASIPWAPTRHLSVGTDELRGVDGFDERLPDLTVAALDLADRLNGEAHRVAHRPALCIECRATDGTARMAADAGRSAQCLAVLQDRRRARTRRLGPRHARPALRWAEPLLDGDAGVGRGRRERLALRAAFSRGAGAYPLPVDDLARGGLHPEPGSERPPVAVVVPFAGNGASGEALLDALAALRRRPGDEVIAVDNSRSPVLGPRDGIAVIRADAQWSSYHARNIGSRAATAPWLLFLDADCIPSPGLLDAFFAPPLPDDVGAVAGAVLNPPDQQGWIARWSAAVDVMSQVRPLSRPSRPFAVTANLLVRRRALEELEGFVEGIQGGGDADFCWRLLAAGWRLDYRPRAAVVHLHRTGWGGLLKQYRRYGSSVAWLDRRYPGAAAGWLRVTPPMLAAPLVDLVAGRFELALSRVTTLVTLAAAKLGGRHPNRPLP